MSREFELLETMRWTRDDGWYLLDRHLSRLEASARFFGFTCSLEDVRAALDRITRASSPALRVRLLLAEDGTVRLEHTPLEIFDRVLRLRPAVAPIDPADPFLYHKTTHRAVYDRPRLPECDDVVLWNPAGEATETTIANLVVETGAGRVTPPVACGLLPGTMRAELLAAGQVAEARVSMEQLLAARRFWLVNSVRGWCAGELIKP